MARVGGSRLSPGRADALTAVTWVDGGLPRAKAWSCVVALGSAALFAAAYEGTRGFAREPALLALGAIAAATLAIIAVARFEAFVLVLLVIRSSLDALKLGGASAGMGIEATQAIAGLFVVTSLVWLTSPGAHEGERSPRGIARAGAAFMVAAVVATVGAADVGASVVELLRIGSGFLMFVVVHRLLSVGRVSAGQVVGAMLASVVVPVGVALMQRATGTGSVVIDNVARVRGTFVHPNSLAIYLAIIIVFGLAVIGLVGWPWRVGPLSLIALSIVALGATYTRGAWIAASAGVIVVVGRRSRSAAMGVLVLVAVSSISLPSVAARWADLQETRHATGDAGNSLVWRVEHWSESVALAAEDPVTGVGLAMADAQTEDERKIHNDLIRSFVEMGVLGLGAYIALVLAAAGVAREAAVTASSGRDKAIASGCLGVGAVFLVASLADNVISQVVLLWYFAAVLALAAHVTAGRRQVVER